MFCISVDVSCFPEGGRLAEVSGKGCIMAMKTVFKGVFLTFEITTYVLLRWAFVGTCIKDIHIFVIDMSFGISYKF